MTTIASVQGDGWAVVGYDSRVTEEDGRTYVLPKDAGKVFKSGNFILGVAGDVRAINLMTHVFKAPPCTASTLGVKLDKFMTAVFIPELKKCFEEASYSKDGDQESQIMVLINGTIYEIGEDYSWCHDTTGLYAIGSGADFALGALNALSEGRNRTLTTARATIKTALAVSSKFDNKTAEPFYLLTQYRD
jgi:ATP-dependent protease HslVU (ClpYQ) peptidase subunit